MNKLVDKTDFPGAKDIAYLNAASIALMPKVAGDSIVEWNRELAQIGTIASTGQSLLAMSNFGSTSTSDTFTGGLQTYGGGYSF